jgi:RNA 3'-terminal phosphate cyclase (ATP)
MKIDGSLGEGGGQILRSSLALSLVTGKPLVIENIRAKRKKPGLMLQHLSAVTAAAEVSQAHVEGAALGSMRLTFCPGTVR